MARCEQCGNDYHRPIEVRRDGVTHVFDSFECAIQKLAPVCAHCSVRVVGHGVETAAGVIYCCGHCSEAAGAVAHA